MKNFLSISLSILLLMQVLSGTLVMGIFYMNRGYIAKNLCENRSRPSMCCKGKCVLGKMLLKARHRENSSPFRNLQEKACIQFHQHKTISLSQPAATALQQMFHYLEPVSDAHPGSLFRPPRA